MKKLIGLLVGLLITIFGFAQQQTLNPNVSNPGSTSNLREVRRVLNHNDSVLFDGSGGSGSSVVSATFNDSISFANIVTNYSTVNNITDRTIRVDTTGKQVGNGAIISIKGDGVHTVSFNGFANYDPAITFDNTLDVDNIIAFTAVPTALGTKYTYRIINQLYSNTAPTAFAVSIEGDSLVGDTLTGHYSYDDIDGDLEGNSLLKWYRSNTQNGVYAEIASQDSGQYIVQSADNFKYLKYGVTSVALTGASPGNLVLSAHKLIGGLDIDAAAYLDSIDIPNDETIFYDGTAYEITGTEIRAAVQVFVQGLKTDTLWTLFQDGKHFIYPYIGGDSTKHARNLIDPRNLDAAFRITWNGATLTHDGSGVTPNGTTGYGNTHLVPNTVALSATSTTLSTYIIGATGSTTSYEMGCNSAAGNAMYIAPCYGGNSEYSAAFGTTYTNYSNPTSLAAFYVSSRTASNVQRAYKNAVFKDDNTGTNGTATGTRPLYIFAYNSNGTIQNYSVRKHGLDALSAGMTESNVIKWTNRVNALMTALHRNVF